MNTDKFKIGFFSFTEITDPTEHHSYNEWHMLDHMPEQYPIPGIAYGQRWVSTPACAAARAVSEAPLDAVHYLTCYVMTEPVEETLREFYEHGRALGKVGRFHQHRRALLSGPFRVLDGVAAPRVLVRAESVPFRPHRGIYVVVEAAGASDTVAARSRAHERDRASPACGRSPRARRPTRTRGSPATSGSRSPGSTRTRTRSPPRSRRSSDRASRA